MVLWIILFLVITLICFWLIGGGAKRLGDWADEIYDSWRIFVLPDFVRVFLQSENTWLFLAWVVWFISIIVFVYGIYNPEFRQIYFGL